MVKLISLFSSSKGNCTYVGNSEGGILIDAGTSAKRITEALTKQGINPEKIQDIFITHEHTDHISAVRVFAKRHNITVYASEGTLKGMENANALENINFNTISYDGIKCKNFFVKPFKTSHDVYESTGYTITSNNGKKVSVVTDTGMISNDIIEEISGSLAILIESNHDVERLMANPNYPHFLKQRIKSKEGHLSNEDSAKVSAILAERGTKYFILGHISHENNSPDLAHNITQEAIESIYLEDENRTLKEGQDFFIKTAGTGIVHFDVE